MTNATLYEIADEYRPIAEQLEENGGELTPEIQAQLEQVEGDFKDKAERCALHYRNLVAQSEMFKKESQRLSERARSLAKSADAFKDYIKANMEALDLQHIRQGTVELRIKKNSRPTVVADFTQDQLAQQYDNGDDLVTAKFAIDRNLVLERFGENETPPEGIEINRNTHLVIK